ncbi:hypothetical protein F4X86_01150 [Candidatus Saccharibacteria bacterium]|nr:hypothetical protein [Candidatus Saccharibacteria bacterium]
MSRDYETFTPLWHTQPENPADGPHRPVVILPDDLERFEEQAAALDLAAVEAVELADGSVAHVGITPEYQKHRRQAVRKEIAILELRLTMTERLLAQTEASLSGEAAELDKLLAAAKAAGETGDRAIIRQVAAKRQWLVNELATRRDSLTEDCELIGRRLESARTKQQRYS